jgi:hypothetical protein
MIQKKFLSLHTENIENGRADFSRFNEQEHAGLCKAGAAIIGASVVASYARRSITASCHAEGREGGPFNWEIDEKQEQLLEQWARAAGLWFDNSDSILQKNFGPMIAQGAEAKVYYREGDPTVAKERTSIYSTTDKALDAIVLTTPLIALPSKICTQPMCLSMRLVRKPSA